MSTQYAPREKALKERASTDNSGDRYRRQHIRQYTVTRFSLSTGLWITVYPSIGQSCFEDRSLGWEAADPSDPGFLQGLNITSIKATPEVIAHQYQLPHEPFQNIQQELWRPDC
jgi:hypothetical protein